MTPQYVFGIFLLSACSFLNVSSYPAKDDALVQYFSFYGGARGQYLEVTKDEEGKVTGQRIVSEDKLGSEDKIENDANLLAKVMTANLQSLKTLSTNLLKLTTLGKKTGELKREDKNKFKNQLKSLSAAASSMIKLIDELDDVEALFKKNLSLTKSNPEEDNDYVVEEGVGVDSGYDETDIDITVGQHGTIAEAKPVGLAVIGEYGLAASRPLATAIAASGTAIARPIATAVAGVDPAALGINFQVNHSKN